MEFDKVIEYLKDESLYARANFVPIIRDRSARFLYDFVKDNKISSVLEIGTAIGYSGSIILAAGAKSLTTIEIREKYYNIAKNTFKKLKFEDMVEMHLGDAKDVLQDLCEKGHQYDMIFLDGAKGQYLYYLPVLQKLIGNNGYIFADNVLLQGLVEGNEYVPHRKRTMVVNLRKYLKIVNEDPFETTLIRLEDGIAITKIKGENK